MSASPTRLPSGKPSSSQRSRLAPTQQERMSRTAGGDLIEFKDPDGHPLALSSVYTLKYADVVFLLHAFQKKSKTGRETPRRDIELIKQRLREAKRIAKEMMA